MSATNYSILQHNLLPTFGTDAAQRAFLWACDRADADRYQHRAEAFTREVDHLLGFLEPAIDAAAKPFPAFTGEQRSSLLDFILRRHAHWRFPKEAGAWL